MSLKEIRGWQSPRFELQCQPMKPAFLPILGLGALFCFLAIPGQAGQGLEDFDGEAGLGSRWTAAGKVRVAREGIPAVAPDSAGDSGPAGKAMHVVSEDGFAVYTKVPTPEEVDWTEAESLGFWLYQEADTEGRIDVLVLEPDRKGFFWRKCTFSGAGWQRIELPLRWFRWEDRRLPRWSEVAHFGIRGDAGVDIWLDGFELVDDDPDLGSVIPLEELAELAFPGEAADSARVVVDDRAWLLSGAPGLDAERLHAHLTGVRDEIESAIPRWRRGDAQAAPVPCLLVFETQEDYRAFFERLGERMRGTVIPPDSGGYHVLGIAASYWDEAQGTLRPVYTHEFVHSAATNLGLQGSSGSDWFQEGIANLFQIRTHPQAGLSEIIEQGLDDPSYRSSLSGLCSGVGITMNRYWQALSVVDYLIRGEDVSEHFDDLLARIGQTGSVDLREHLEPVYGMDFETFEAGWMAFAREEKDAYEPETSPEDGADPDR